jgi:lipid-binding SYLF domain-containing protein
VLKEIHSVPDKDIPQELWDRAACVIVVPGLKKAPFVIGGAYGKGLMSCRRGGQWSAPIFMQIGKGSWSLQIGAQSIDLVLLVMNANGSRTQGLFACINLSGVLVRADEDDNTDLHGKTIAAKDVVMGGTVKAPAVTDAFMAALRHEK